ncbi:MAG TPA: hypothetical protein ENK61_01115 [Devosia sp.]|nr:hypothetical protein [Devosia sp.]
MKQFLHQIANIAMAGALTFGAATDLSLAQNVGPCLDNRAIANARGSGRILPLVEILRLAQVRPGPNILNIKVCQVNGQLHYLIDLLRRDGRTQLLILRASDGSPYIAA